MSVLKIKRILFSQDAPVHLEKTPYAELQKKYYIKINFFKFFKIEPVPSNEFKKNGINFSDYTAIIMTSKYAVDHFFRVIKELKVILPSCINFFCINESIAIYVQKHLKCKKSQMYFQNDSGVDAFIAAIMEKKGEKFLVPCSSDSYLSQVINLLDEKNIDYTRAEVFKIRYAEVKKKINIYDYNMLVFFSPHGIQSLMQNHPDFKQKNLIIGVFGSQALTAAKEAGLTVQIAAPTVENPSIFMAIDQYLEKVNRKKW